MVIPVYFPADCRRYREGVVEEHGAIVEDPVLAPRLGFLDVGLSQVRSGENPFGGVVLGNVAGRVPFLFRAVRRLLPEFLELPGIVGVGKLEGAAVVRIGEVSLFYLLEEDEGCSEKLPK